VLNDQDRADIRAMLESANIALIITLSAGGIGVTGKVSVLNHWTE